MFNKLAYFLANLSHIFVRLNFQLNYCQQSVVATAVPQCEVSVQPPSAKKIAASTDTNGRMEVSRKDDVVLDLLWIFTSCCTILQIQITLE